MAKDNDTEPIQIQLELLEGNTLEQSLADIVAMINEKLRLLQENYRLSSANLSVYSVHLAKKNGRPKESYPSIYPKELISHLPEERYALVWNQPSALIEN